MQIFKAKKYKSLLHYNKIDNKKLSQLNKNSQNVWLIEYFFVPLHSISRWYGIMSYNQGGIDIINGVY